MGNMLYCIGNLCLEKGALKPLKDPQLREGGKSQSIYMFEIISFKDEIRICLKYSMSRRELALLLGWIKTFTIFGK